MRTAAAFIGGYVIASLGAAFLARFLPLSPDQASLMGAILSFAICTAVVMWAFAAQSITKLWLSMVVIAAMLGLPVWWSIITEGRL